MYCTSCGREFKKEVSFCSSCGTDLRDDIEGKEEISLGAKGLDTNENKTEEKNEIAGVPKTKEVAGTPKLEMSKASSTTIIDHTISPADSGSAPQVIPNNMGETDKVTSSIVEEATEEEIKNSSGNDKKQIKKIAIVTIGGIIAIAIIVGIFLANSSSVKFAEITKDVVYEYGTVFITFEDGKESGTLISLDDIEAKSFIGDGEYWQEKGLEWSEKELKEIDEIRSEVEFAETPLEAYLLNVEDRAVSEEPVPVGEYLLNLKYGEEIVPVNIIIEDTTAPKIENRVGSIDVEEGKKVTDWTPYFFIIDESDVDTTYNDDEIDFAKPGKYTLKIEAVDKYGNTSTGEMTVNVEEKEEEPETPSTTNSNSNNSSAGSSVGATCSANSGATHFNSEAAAYNAGKAFADQSAATYGGQYNIQTKSCSHGKWIVQWWVSNSDVGGYL